ELRRVEGRDGRNSGLALAQGAEERFHAQPDRAQHPHARDKHPPEQDATLFSAPLHIRAMPHGANRTSRTKLVTRFDFWTHGERSTIECPWATMMELESGRPTREAILGLFRDTASEVVERDLQHVVESMRIDELVIDSLGMLEIVGSLERRL